MPLDLIPDFVPVIGHLDDVIIVPALAYLGLRFIRAELLAEHRRHVGGLDNLVRRNSRETERCTLDMLACFSNSGLTALWNLRRAAARALRVKYRASMRSM
jgi:hypothetical protein